MLINKGDLLHTFIIIGVFFLGIVGIAGGKKAVDSFLKGREELSFSVESGFYDHDIFLEVTSQKPGIIYYTTDGSIPEADSAATCEYWEPIPLTAGGELTVSVFRFRLLQKSGVLTDTVTKSFYMGKNVKNRFDTLVMSIVTDRDNLYSHENGIFVEGKVREDYLLAHPDEEVDSDTPANYNLRGKMSERAAYLEVFEPNGSCVVQKDCGIRTSGGATRESEQKSFKLYARREYSEDNKFRYPFFPDELQKNGNMIVDEYECIKVRNTGNDRLEAFIRDELGMRLSEQAALQDVQYVRPVSVYINGTYNGLYWLHSVYDDAYFKERYGNYTGEMVVIGAQEGNMETEGSDQLESTCAIEYNEWYEKAVSLDLTEKENYRFVEDTIDVENYLSYVAAEVYMANQDWPYNNEKVYRYVSEDEDYQEGSVFDGRYRYLIYDTDTAMGHGMIADTMNAAQSYEKLCNLIDDNTSRLFSALMKREDCKKEFVSNLCGLLNGAFSTENILKVLKGMEKERENEMKAYVEESEKNENLTDISPYYTNMQMDSIREWAKVTPDNLLENLSNRWELGEIYTLGIAAGAYGTAFVNEQPITEYRDSKTGEFRGRYFSECPTTLSAAVAEGRKFVCWQINGLIVEEPDVTLQKDMILDGVIYAVLVTEEKEQAGLSLEAVKARGQEDYILLANHTSKDIDTTGYYVADNEKVSHMNYLNSQIVKPGEVIKIIGRSNIADEEGAVLRTNFNIALGETVRLGTTDGIESRILDQVTIPKLNIEGGVYQKDTLTGTWSEKCEKNF